MEPLLSEPGAVVEPLLVLLPGALPAELFELLELVELVELLVEVSIESVLTFLVLRPRAFLIKLLILCRSETEIFW